MIKIPYSITTRQRTVAAPKARGRKRAELPEDVASAVRGAVENRVEETVIGPFTDEAEAKKLWGGIKARLRDETFGPGLSARGGVAASTDGSKYAVIFSITNRRAKSKKADDAAETAEVSEESAVDEELQPA